MGTQDGSTILRTILAVGLIGLGLVAAVIGRCGGPRSVETRAAYRLQFDHAVESARQAIGRRRCAARRQRRGPAWHDAYGAALAAVAGGDDRAGDAFLGSHRAGTVNGSGSNARQAYLQRAHPGPS